MTDYPATLIIDYSDRSNRLTAFFRVILAVPILIILSLLSFAPAVTQNESGDPDRALWLGGLLIAPALLMILFRKK